MNSLGYGDSEMEEASLLSKSSKAVITLTFSSTG